MKVTQKLLRDAIKRTEDKLAKEALRRWLKSLQHAQRFNQAKVAAKRALQSTPEYQAERAHALAQFDLGD